MHIEPVGTMSLSPISITRPSQIVWRTRFLVLVSLLICFPFKSWFPLWTNIIGNGNRRSARTNNWPRTIPPPPTRKWPTTETTIDQTPRTPADRSRTAINSWRTRIRRNCHQRWILLIWVIRLTWLQTSLAPMANWSQRNDSGEWTTVSASAAANLVTPSAIATFHRRPNWRVEPLPSRLHQVPPLPPLHRLWESLGSLPCPLSEGCGNSNGEVKEVRLNTTALTNPDSLYTPILSPSYKSLFSTRLVDSSSSHCFVNLSFISSHSFPDYEISPVILRLLDSSVGAMIMCAADILICFATNDILLVKFYITKLDSTSAFVFGHN